MTMLDEQSRGSVEAPEASAREDARLRLWFVFGLLMVCGLLILAHGCHGDEDHELFGALTHRAVAN